MATAHLIHGYLCAGKTALACELERSTGGIRFSLDEWYLRLFAESVPTVELDQDALDRLSGILNEVWPKLLERGIDVVLDFGFWSRQSRDDARDLAMAAGADVKIYSVLCAEEVARARCLARNGTAGSVSFLIDQRAFDALKPKFEALEPDEAHELIDTT